MSDLDWVEWALRHCGARELLGCSPIQSLWGGYGELLRLRLGGGPMPSAILKRVLPPPHARELISDRRKRRSYEVERAWYASGARHCDASCRVARCLAFESSPDGSLLLLEDLGNAGFHPHRPPRTEHVGAGLRWLAHLHARLLGQCPEGLWEQGTYWHLETRAQEWERMPSGALKEAARELDRRLREARYLTVVHGDAKPSNFLWGEAGGAAAVDFQYVGPGCGIRDVVYFLDSCLGERGCEAEAEVWLERYFASLQEALSASGKGSLSHEVEQEWRALYPVAWSDFQRFYQGWGRPGPLGSYSLRQLDLALRDSS